MEATTELIPGIVIRRFARGSSNACCARSLSRFASLTRDAPQLVDVAFQHAALLALERQRLQPTPAGGTEQMPFVLRDQIGVEERLDAPLCPYQLGKNAHSLCNLPSSDQRDLVRHPDLRQEPGSVQLGEYLRINLVSLDAGVSDCLDEPRICDGDPLHKRAEKSSTAALLPVASMTTSSLVRSVRAKSMKR